MASVLDVFAAMRVIAADPDLFADIRPDMDRAVRACVVKQMKAKASGLDRLHAICRTLGHRNFGLIVDGMKDAEVKALIGRLDRQHSGPGAADAEWRRNHLRALAEGRIEPAAQPAAAPKTARPAKPAQKPPGILASKAMAAVRKR